MRHIKQISCFGMLLCGAFSVIAAPSANDGASGIKAQIAAERKGSAKVSEEALAATEAKLNTATAKLNAATARADAATAERDAAVEKLRQTARNLKTLNLTTEQIAAATGLSASEIETI